LDLITKTFEDDGEDGDGEDDDAFEDGIGRGKSDKSSFRFCY